MSNEIVSNLKPLNCPMCGEKPTTIIYPPMSLAQQEKHLVKCGNPECLLFYIECAFFSFEYAVKAWNHRYKGPTVH